MVCQNCGTQLPDGTPVCSTCGAQLMAAQQPYVDPNQAYAQPDFNQSPYGAAAPAKKNNTGMIIGIVAAVVAIVAVAIVLINSLGGSDYDGTYKLTKCSMLGIEYSIEDLESSMNQSLDMSLTIKGNKCTLDAAEMGLETGSCKIKIDGDVVTLIDGDQELVGSYDADTKSITISESGVDMIFELQ